MRPSVAGIAAAVLACLAGTAVVVREFRLQRDIEELKRRSVAQSDRLNAVLSGQEDLAQTSRVLAAALQSVAANAGHARGEAPGAEPRPGTEKVAAAAEETRPAPPSPEAVESAEKARVVIDGAIVTGRWTEQNRDELRGLLRKLPGEERIDLQRRVLAALNAHQLDFQAPGPPF